MTEGRDRRRNRGKETNGKRQRGVACRHRARHRALKRQEGRQRGRQSGQSGDRGVVT